MDNEIPAYFEDIEPFDEISFDSLSPLIEAEKQRYGALLETHRVPDPGKFTFLQYPLSFFSLGIGDSGKVQSALLIIDDHHNGEKIYQDLITCNNEPDLVLRVQADAGSPERSSAEGQQLITYTWHLGKSAMSVSSHPLPDSNEPSVLTRIHLRIID